MKPPENQQDAIQDNELPMQSSAAVFDINSSLSHIFHRIGQYAGDLHIKEFGRGGITSRQFAIMTVLAKFGAASQVKLVNETGIDRSTLAEILGRMEKNCVIEREKSLTDSRANVVKLSASGAEIYEQCLPGFQKIDNEILVALGENKGRKFIEIAIGLVGKAKIAPKIAAKTKTKDAKKSPASKVNKTAKIGKNKKAKKAKRSKK